MNISRARLYYGFEFGGCSPGANDLADYIRYRVDKAASMSQRPYGFDSASDGQAVDCLRYQAALERLPVVVDCCSGRKRQSALKLHRAREDLADKSPEQVQINPAPMTVEPNPIDERLGDEVQQRTRRGYVQKRLRPALTEQVGASRYQARPVAAQYRAEPDFSRQ